MKRFYLFELEDQPWFPSIIRDGGTDFLGFIFNTLKLYQPAVPLLKRALQESGQAEILDMCSGSGGPMESICQAINEDATKEKSQSIIMCTLSDKFPNLESYRVIQQRSGGDISFIEKPVDIMHDDIPHLGLRTMFSAIHHFKPEQVQQIITKIIESKKPLAFFDGGNKSWWMVLLVFIGHPVMFFLFTPFIRPFKLSRIFFTYFFPLIPLYTMWDGIVSIFRLHTPDELHTMAQAADANQLYNWQSGKARSAFGVSVAYLIGIPK